MPAIPPKLTKAIPILTQVVRDLAPSMPSPPASGRLDLEALRPHLEARLNDALEELVQAQLQALQPLLRARIHAVVQDVLDEVAASQQRPSA